MCLLTQLDKSILLVIVQSILKMYFVWNEYVKISIYMNNTLSLIVTPVKVSYFSVNIYFVKTDGVGHVLNISLVIGMISE